MDSYVEDVQLLVDKAANVDVQSGNYRTTLQATSWGGYVEITQLLLDKGATTETGI